MNRRSFIKTAALAAVAVPVVGVPAPAPGMAWVIRFKKGDSLDIDLGGGTGITCNRDQAIDWFIEWTKQGYTMMVKYAPLAEARF